MSHSESAAAAGRGDPVGAVTAGGERSRPSDGRRGSEGSGAGRPRAGGGALYLCRKSDSLAPNCVEWPGPTQLPPIRGIPLLLIRSSSQTTPLSCFLYFALPFSQEFTLLLIISSKKHFYFKFIIHASSIDSRVVAPYLLGQLDCSGNIS